MLLNYLKIAWRNLTKNKFSSIINIGGLGVGMGISMLIALWLYDELSYNKSHTRYKRLAKVVQNVTNNGQVQTAETVPYPLAAELRKDYGSDFKRVVLAGGNGMQILSVGNKKLTKEGVYLEPDGPELLSLQMISGSRNGLSDPASIMLSESVARAFFGKADPLDKIMQINNELNVKVTGVYKDIAYNSSFNHVSFIAPWQLYFNNTEWIRTTEDPWRPNAFHVYVEMADNADFGIVSGKIKDVRLKNVNAQLAKKKPALFLHPMSKWHLYSDFKDGFNIGGRIKYVWMFGIIAIFVLLLACINFMNLSTARSEKRAKEVGIRKAVGSLRQQLIYQFFTESIVVVTFSFLLAIVLVIAMLPFFNAVADKKMSVPFTDPLFWTLGLAFSFVTGIIAGSYPAFYLSSFEPVKILKGTFKVGRWSAIPRKVLVVLQFTVSISMIIGTIVVFRQIQYAKDRPLGYNTNGLITVPLITPDIHKHFDAVKSELIQSRTVLEVAETGNPTTQVWGTSSGFDWRGKDPNLSVDFPRVDVSYDYGKTINWEFLQGRDFSKEFASDSSGLIINESAAKFMGFENPVGEVIKWFGEPYTVIGVVKDMIMQNPYDPVRPTVFRLYVNSQNFVILRLNPQANPSAALSKIEHVFKKFNPDQPFQYSFVDEDYAKKFGNEERVGKLAGSFAMLAIFISCLGLFGMASFVAQQRIKEIGVRKVLGATVFNLWGLLSKDFLVLVIISMFVAGPLSYYFMNRWLEGYEYRTTLSAWIFLIAAGGALVIALLTVSYQAIRAALANPVKSLRSE